jgi:GNAT superfamily N-acetyltransferase
VTTPLPTRPMRSDDDDLRSFAECFADNGYPRALDQLRWQYLETPERRLLVDFGVGDEGGTERVAGIYAVFPVACLVAGKSCVGAQSLDTMTDRRYRGRGLFVDLARGVYKRAEDERVAFVYGFPNGNSAHGFFTKLGWKSLDPVPFLIRPLRTRYFLARAPWVGRLLGWLPDMPLPLPREAGLRLGEAIARSETFGQEFDTLWRDFARDVTVGVQRDSRYLAWRFDRKPGESYDTLVLRVDGHLVGFITYCVKKKHGGRIGYVMELIYRPGLARGGRLLLARALAAMSVAGADAVLAWNFSHSGSHPAFRATGFFTLPSRLRPIELHFGVRALDDSIGSVVRDRGGWYLSYCDSDTV